MTEPRPLPPPDAPPGPSLAGRALGWRPGLPRPNRRTIALTAIALLIGLLVALLLLSLPNDRPAPAPARQVRTAPTVEPLAATIAALSRALPESARLAQVDRAGRLTMIAETAEPDRLRAALAADPAFARLRTTSEVALADGGYRVTMEGPAEAPAPQSAGPPLDPGRLAALARARRLLVERIAATGTGTVDLVASGREADILAFASAIESGRPVARLQRWRLAALDGGAVRLDTRVTRADRRAAAAKPNGRALFATSVASPTAPDAPELAGIVGRLPDDAVALVRGPDGRAVSVAPGQNAPGDWRLEALSVDAAVFMRGAERARVSLPPE